MEVGLQGDCVWLAPLSHQAGFGVLPPPVVPPPPPDEAGQASCSCSLSPVTVVEERMQGVASFSRLIPPLLRSTVNLPWCTDQDSALTLSSPVHVLRRAHLYIKKPSFTAAGGGGGGT